MAASSPRLALASSLVVGAVLAAACSSSVPPPPASPTPVQPPPTAAAPPEPPPPAAPASSIAAPAGSAGQGWVAFDDVGSALLEGMMRQWSPTSQCPDYDYFPQGGIRNFWCHRPESLTLERVRELAGVDLFVSGPHSRSDLKLDAPGSFGHYNPAFVRWLVDKAAPAGRDTPLRQSTQMLYDASVRPLAEIFWKTYEKAQREPDCFAREKATYERLIASKIVPRGYPDRWYFFMNPFFCQRAPRGASQDFNFFYENGMDGGIDGNVAKTVVGFWLRRAMDGTMEEFARGLKKLVASYQPRLLVASAAIDADALKVSLDGAIKAMSLCQAPRAGSVYAAFSLNPSGRFQLDQFNHRSPSPNVYTPAPSTQSPALKQCLEKALAAHPVPAFGGEALKFSRSFNVRGGGVQDVPAGVGGSPFDF